jgi:hypothetical protein
VACSSYHVCHAGEAEVARSPYAGISVVAERTCSLLPHKVLSLVLELCHGGL